MVTPRSMTNHAGGPAVAGAYTRLAPLSGAGVTSNNEFIEEGYDQEKWGTPEEWDKAIGHLVTINRSADLSTESIQAQVRDSRLAAANRGHKEARR